MDGDIRRPRYIEQRPSNEKFDWWGDDYSFQIFAHINMDWRTLQSIYSETRKPVADFGSSCSTLAAEGALRGIDVVPIDLMHEHASHQSFGKVYERVANDWKMRATYRQGPGDPTLPMSIGIRMGIDDPIADFYTELTCC